MTNSYIPVNQEAENQVKELISKQRIFGDVDQFIHLYNEAFINVNKKEIKDLANLIANSYSNVILQRNKLFVKSADETYVDKALFILESWKLILAMKRVAEDIIADDNPVETKLVFFTDKSRTGYVYLEGELDEEGNITEESFDRYEAAERLTTSETAIPSNIYLKPFIKIYDEIEGAYYIEAYQLINLDTEFIKEINRIIDNAVQK